MSIPNKVTSGIVSCVQINFREYRRDNQSQMDNPECTQDEDKQNKNTTQYVLDTTLRKLTQSSISAFLFEDFVYPV